MHSPAPSLDRAIGHKRANVKKSKTEGASGGRPQGPTQPLLNPEAYERFLKALGPDLDSAAKKIREAQPAEGRPCRCNRSTLYRHLHPKREPALITHVLLEQMGQTAEATGSDAEKDFHLATLPEIVQDRMQMHFDWMDTFLGPFGRNRTYRSVKHAIYKRYNYPGKVIWEFRNWMNRNFIRPERQEIAIWRVLLPLIEHNESGGIEPTWRDWLDKGADGQPIETDGGDTRLVEFLRKRCDSEQEVLKVRGNDLHRARASQINPIRKKAAAQTT